MHRGWLLDTDRHFLAWMNKKDLTEADIRTKFITPALVPPGGKWDLMSQLREEVYFTRGGVTVAGSEHLDGKAGYFNSAAAPIA